LSAGKSKVVFIEPTFQLSSFPAFCQLTARNFLFQIEYWFPVSENLSLRPDHRAEDRTIAIEKPFLIQKKATPRRSPPPIALEIQILQGFAEAGNVLEALDFAEAGEAWYRKLLNSTSLPVVTPSAHPPLAVCRTYPARLRKSGIRPEFPLVFVICVHTNSSNS